VREISKDELENGGRRKLEAQGEARCSGKGDGELWPSGGDALVWRLEEGKPKRLKSCCETTIDVA